MFSDAEIRSLSQARTDLGWVPLPDAMPATIYHKILEYRSDTLQEIERRAAAGLIITHAPAKPKRHRRAMPNQIGCQCDCENCQDDDCLGCLDENCDDEACQDFRERAAMQAHLKAIADWIS